MVAESPAKRKKSPFGPGSPIPLSVRLAVRSFYLLQGLKPMQIAPLVGLSAQQVANLAIREGWSKQRTVKKAEKESRALERQNAHAEKEISAIHAAIAVRTEELSVKTLDHCANLLSEPMIDAKNLQMASGAAKNFVTIARMSRGLDQRNGPQNSQGDGAAHQTLIFVGALERAAPKPERNVTEVSAKPVPDSPPALPA